MIGPRISSRVKLHAIDSMGRSMARTDDFEWDDDKERANHRDHGFAFWDAAPLVFEASDIIEDIDDRFEYDEERWIAFARVHTIVVCCVYTGRGRRRRIISLRRATRAEVQRFEADLRASED